MAYINGIEVNIISYDIETIPMSKDITSEIQKNLLEKRIESLKQYSGKDTIEENEINKLQATSPYFGEIVCIGIYEESPRYPNGHSAAVYQKKGISEKDILKQFWDHIEGFHGTFVSFNGLSFDAPFIRNRSWKYGIPLTNKNFIKLQRFSTYPHFDVMKIFSNWEIRNTIGLEGVTDFFSVPSPKEGEVKAENVYDAYLDGRIVEIAEYCKRDVESTALVYKSMLKLGY